MATERKIHRWMCADGHLSSEARYGRCPAMICGVKLCGKQLHRLAPKEHRSLQLDQIRKDEAKKRLKRAEQDVDQCYKDWQEAMDELAEAQENYAGYITTA